MGLRCSNKKSEEKKRRLPNIAYFTHLLYSVLTQKAPSIHTYLIYMPVLTKENYKHVYETERWKSHRTEIMPRALRCHTYDIRKINSVQKINTGWP